MMRFARLCVVALVLTGCKPDIDSQLAECRLDSLKVYAPHLGRIETDSYERNYVQTCMQAKGYDLVLKATPKCPAFTIPIWETSCYVERSWWKSLTK